MPEQGEQDDDWDWNTEQPQEYPSAESHGDLLLHKTGNVSSVKTWNNVNCCILVPSENALDNEQEQGRKFRQQCEPEFTVHRCYSMR